MNSKSFVLFGLAALSLACLASCGPSSPATDPIVVYQDMAEAKIDRLRVEIAGIYPNQSYSPAAKGYRTRIVFRFVNAGEGELEVAVKDPSLTCEDDSTVYKVAGFPASEKLQSSKSTLVISDTVTPTPIGESRYSLAATINATKYVVHLYDKPDSERKDYNVVYKVGQAEVRSIKVKENRPIGQDYVYETPDHLSYCNVWKNVADEPVGSGTKVRADLTAYGQSKDNILFQSDSATECAATSLDYIPMDRVVVVPKEHKGVSVSRIGDGFFFSKPAKEIYLPKSIKAIGERNFSCCTLLQTIHFEGTEEEWKAIDNASKENIPEGIAIRYESIFNG